MNILIPDSWLRDYLETNATPKEFAREMSLTSVSIERMEKVGDDIVYDIEVTTNRPDLMSIEGIAREASAVLPQAGFTAKFKKRKQRESIETSTKSPLLQIANDPSLVNRILAVVMEIQLASSPDEMTKRLEKTGIRSINNVVDVTNYIMREIGHPSHVFDYDRLPNHTLNIRKSKKGEKIVTLDDKEYILLGDDIVADSGTGEIVDLLGIMGTANSVVVDTTRRIVLFLDNVNHNLLRKSSMNLGIRTEAAVLNEKGIDPELMMESMLRGIELLEKNAKGKMLTPIIDMYPNKVKTKNLQVEIEKIGELVGIEIEKKTVISILENLGFNVVSNGDVLNITVPTTRINDVDIPEDIIEEVARVYGYHKIPNALPSLPNQSYYHQDQNEFYWIQKIKEGFKYWGYNEIFTYSLVSEELFDGPIENAVKLKNPLTEDKGYLRNSLIPSVLETANINNREIQRLFEVANVYLKKKSGLPDEVLHLAVVLRGNSTFFDGKGIVERLGQILGITKLSFDKKTEGIEGAYILYDGVRIGIIEADEDVAIELNLAELLKHANSKKIYIEKSKFPPIIEDVRVTIPVHYPFAKIEKAIKEVHELIYSVTLLDVYKNKKTFRITYMSRSQNLTNDDISPLRHDIEDLLVSHFKASLG